MDLASLIPLAIKASIFLVLLPLAAGTAFRRVAPAPAEGIAKLLSRTATILLLAGSVPTLIIAWPAIASLIKEGGILPVAINGIVSIPHANWRKRDQSRLEAAA